MARPHRSVRFPDATWKVLAAFGGAALVIDVVARSASVAPSSVGGLGLLGLLLLTLAWLAHVASARR